MERLSIELGLKAGIRKLDGGNWYLELPNNDLVNLGDNVDDLSREFMRNFFKELEEFYYRGNTIVLAMRELVLYVFVYQLDALVHLEEVEYGQSIALSSIGGDFAFVPFEIENIAVIKDKQFNFIKTEASLDLE